MLKKRRRRFIPVASPSLPYNTPLTPDGSALISSYPNLWTPANLSRKLGYILSGWYDAKDTSTITLNGSTVSQWNDKGLLFNNCAQSNASQQPTYQPTGLNGLPCLYFDGISNFLYSLQNIGIEGNPLFSIYTAQTASLSPGTGATYVSFGGNDPFSTFYYQSSTNDDVALELGFADGIQNAYCEFYDPSIPFVGSFRRLATGGSGWNFRQNGATLPSTVVYDDYINLTPGPLNIGTYVNNPFFGEMKLAELIIVPLNVDDYSNYKMEGYLAWKWGMVSSLPITHPYKYYPPTI